MEKTCFSLGILAHAFAYVGLEMFIFLTSWPWPWSFFVLSIFNWSKVCCCFKSPRKMKPSPRFSTKNTSWCFNGWGACHPGLKHFRRAAIFGGESSKTCSIFGHSKLWGVFDSSKPPFLGYLLDMLSPRSGKTRSSFSWVFQFFGRRIVRGSPDSEALTVGFTSVLPSSSPLVYRSFSIHPKWPHQLGNRAFEALKMLVDCSCSVPERCSGDRTWRAHWDEANIGECHNVTPRNHLFV